jgi:hypothetical protein
VEKLCPGLWDALNEKNDHNDGIERKITEAGRRRAANLRAGSLFDQFEKNTAFYLRMV